MKKMNAPPSLKGSHLRTYERIFQHPVSHNLGWLDVLGMFRQLGQVEEEANGNLRVTRNGQLVVLPPPRTKDVAETEEVMAIRHFLEKSEASEPASGPGDSQWLVVIDHHEARLFMSEAGGASPLQILPPEPGHFFRHAHNSKDFSRGKEKPDPNSYFEPLAKALLHAGKILIFGSGTGTSSEMDQFTGWLSLHRPELSRRVVGCLVVDGHHLTDGQLLKKARDFFAAPQLSPA